MRQFKPCMRCKNSHRLFADDPKLAVAVADKIKELLK
jgi:hypothetical protein